MLKSLKDVAGPAIGLAIAARIGVGLAAIAMAFALSGAVDAVVFAGADLSMIAGPLAAMVVLALARSALVTFAEHKAAEAGAAIRCHLFARVIDQAEALGPVRLSDTPTGEIATLALEAVAGTEAYWRRWMPAKVEAAVLPLAILLVALPLDWLTGLVLLVTVPLLPIFMILAGRAAERASAAQWATLARLSGQVLDAIRGLVDLKLLGAAERMTVKVEAGAEDYRKTTMAVLRIAFLSALVLEFFATVSIALVAVLVGFRLMWGTLDFRTGFFLLLLAPEFYAPLRQMGVQRHARMEAEAAGARIAAFLDRPAPRPAGRDRPDLTAISLAFDKVTVRHDDGRVALDAVSFDIAAGEHVALVGESGSGKSTILALLSGHLMPSEGRILVNGQTLDDIDPAHWRRNIAVVPQKPHLFDASLGANVALSDDWDAPTVMAALKKARASSLVEQLPGGLSCRLGESGAGLSGGEAQRIALARAFIRPAALILADEPTAHLDAGTEADVTAALQDLARGHTRLTVAHRLDTIAGADRLIVLASGRIVAEGPPATLLRADGALAEMIRTAGQWDDEEALA